ncbi:hypothetical protein [Salimicrobium flavidum]|uniref:Uncharacterized protein n=1 Tax=Salimicrobium flavidum TaxID=570947 RepID=A0A1N7JS10_9BACI|nr:hypothetical protein [Salimicrobium flavidum]SIS52142.1 hypothetical protein SAMN05421687_107125 [Salimicrobium flavidum]
MYKQFTTDILHLPTFILNDEGEHADDLLNGNLFMKNLKYFIDLEKNTGEKGRGDKREAAHVIRSQHVKVIDPKTEKVIATANEGEIIERYTNAPKVPVFCFTLFKALLNVGVDIYRKERSSK